MEGGSYAAVPQVFCSETAVDAKDRLAMEDDPMHGRLAFDVADKQVGTCHLLAVELLPASGT